MGWSRHPRQRRGQGSVPRLRTRGGSEVPAPSCRARWARPGAGACLADRGCRFPSRATGRYPMLLASIDRSRRGCRGFRTGSMQVLGSLFFNSRKRPGIMDSRFAQAPSQREFPGSAKQASRPSQVFHGLGKSMRQTSPVTCRSLLIAGLLYLACLLVAVLPYPLGLARNLPSAGDPSQHLWIMRWYKTCLLEKKNSFSAHRRLIISEFPTACQVSRRRPVTCPAG